MKPETLFGRKSAIVLAALGIALLMTMGTAFTQTPPGAAGGASRGGGGGRDYGGGPTRLLESRELPPSVKGISDRVCDSGTIESSYYAGIFHYQCLGSAPVLTMRPGDQPTPRAKIGADCAEKDGKPVNCVWNCSADEDSDCAGFITTCVDQDGDVEGNKGGAKCSFP